MNKKATFRFYEELNDFLTKNRKKVRFEHQFIDRTSVKDVIESFGVPHTEIDLIIVNQKSVDFNYIINNGDDISVYPVFESFDISEVQHLRPNPLRSPKFVCDVHLGRLSRYLRMLGFDAAYENNFNDDEIVKISLAEKRTILTRDRGILKRSEVTHGYYLRNSSSKMQTEEIVWQFHLQNLIKEFSRCLECNSELIKIEKSKITNELPPKVAKSKEDFTICPACRKIYWKGSHHNKMLALVENFKKSNLH